MKIKKNHWWEIIVAGIALVSGHLVAIGINGEALFHDWFHYPESYKWIAFIFAILIFGLSLSYITHIALTRLRFRALSPSECKPKKAMIIFLSRPKPLPDSDEFPLLIGGESGVVLKGEDLKTDIEELKKTRWNWEMLMRSMLPHENSLEYVHIIGSADESEITGSQRDIPKAEGILKKYFPELKIEKTSEAISFEDFTALSKYLFKLIGRLKRDGYAEDDIVIDITGGQKPTSVAGAITTINQNVKFQYISTNTKKCVVYNIMYAPPPKLE